MTVSRVCKFKVGEYETESVLVELRSEDFGLKSDGTIEFISGEYYLLDHFCQKFSIEAMINHPNATDKVVELKARLLQLTPAAEIQKLLSELLRRSVTKPAKET
jgi:hypothetical protein